MNKPNFGNVFFFSINCNNAIKTEIKEMCGACEINTSSLSHVCIPIGSCIKSSQDSCLPGQDAYLPGQESYLPGQDSCLLGQDSYPPSIHMIKQILLVHELFYSDAKATYQYNIIHTLNRSIY